MEAIEALNPTAVPVDSELLSGKWSLLYTGASAEDAASRRVKEVRRDDWGARAGNAPAAARAEALRLHPAFNSYRSVACRSSTGQRRMCIPVPSPQRAGTCSRARALPCALTNSRPLASAPRPKP